LNPGGTSSRENEGETPDVKREGGASGGAKKPWSQRAWNLGAFKGVTPIVRGPVGRQVARRRAGGGPERGHRTLLTVCDGLEKKWHMRRGVNSFKDKNRKVTRRKEQANQKGGGGSHRVEKKVLLRWWA